MEVSIHMAQCIRYTLEMQKHVASCIAFVQSINPEWLLDAYAAKEEYLAIFMTNNVTDTMIHIGVPYDYLDSQDGRSFEYWILNKYEEKIRG